MHFWFEDIEREQWFKQDIAFDSLIRERFLQTYLVAKQGDYDDWGERGRSALALCIVLDQFPRNLFRVDPKSFATDAKVLGLARSVVERGFDVGSGMDDENRHFFYLPFMHSEAVDDQRLCVDLVETRMENEKVLKFAREHLLVIERFGRFPHRNRILGRSSTAEELAYLAQDGSGF